MKFIALLVMLNIAGVVMAQNSLNVTIKDEKTGDPLIGANGVLKGTTIGASSDTTGHLTIKHIPDGERVIVFSYVGYKTVEKKLTFPRNESKGLTIFLEPSASLGALRVYSTRTKNRITEVPTKVEVLGKEEVVEETAIKPGNISKLLGETSGVQLRQTSAISGNMSFRIEGLPGKYTQLLKNGFPLYSGYSSGLSLLQIPPLDLQQVEIVKGAASTLYGGDAIAGIINLITKKPQEEPDLSLLFNQTQKGGRDVSSFYSGRHKKLGLTMLAGYSHQDPRDISQNNYTDIPKYNRAVAEPKVFYDLNKHSHLYVGGFAMMENRTGGNIGAVQNHPNHLHPFFVRNKTRRLNGYMKFTHTGPSGNILRVKSSFSNFNRKLKTNVNAFGGTQNMVFSELSYLVKGDHHSWVSGLNYYGDDFKQALPRNSTSLSYAHQTVGVFSQDNWQLDEKLYLEPGLRFDYNRQYGSFFLPRLALLYHFTDTFFGRLSGGMGYKLPTPFTDEAERSRYQKVMMPENLTVETSHGLNLDFNYKTFLSDDLHLTLNQSFFVINIDHPIIANPDSLARRVVYNENADGRILSKGFDTNARLSLEDLTLYLDFTHLNARKSYDNNNQLQLTPGNKFTSTLAYEDEEEGWKAGLEAFYIGHQYLESGRRTPAYWLLGASVQKTISHFTLALNVENMLDIRQSRYEDIVSGPPDNPQFNELYAPLDGIVGNVVLKVNLLNELDKD